MAAKSEKSDIRIQMKNFIECCICADVFDDPRTLPCLHTFCLNCLEQTRLGMEIEPGKSMPCPVCRNKFCIPLLGLAELPKNFYVESLKELLAKSGEKEHYCNVCSFESQEACAQLVAEVYCVNCEDHFCTICNAFHENQRCFAGHKVLAVSSENYQREYLAKIGSEPLPKNECLQHKKESRKLYCFDCRSVICKKCFAENHQQHVCLHTVKAAAELQKKAKKDVEMISACQNIVLERQKTLTLAETSLLKEFNNIEGQILGRNAEIKDLVDKCTSELLHDLNSRKQKTVEEVKNRIDDLEGHIGVAESLKTFYCSLNSSSSAVDVCNVLNEFYFSINEPNLLISGDRSIPLPRFAFKKMEGDSLLEKNCQSIFGSIQEFPVAFNHRLNIPHCSLHGVAKLFDRIYILCQLPNTIIVFRDQHPFTVEKEITLLDCQEPFDMASCHASNCLYIADSRKSIVWKILPGEPRVISWLEHKGYCATLSVSADGHVIIPMKAKQASLRVYRSDASLFHEIFLEPEFSDILHAVEKKNGNFIVSYGTFSGFGICEITGDGSVLRQFKPSSCDMTRLFKYPCHLTLLSDDRVLVADFYNNRVIVLDSLLAWEHTLLSRDVNGIDLPWRLFYDEIASQLLVVHGEGKVAGGRKNVDIYSLKSAS